VITDGRIFCYETVVGQCSTESHEDFFQRNFTNNLKAFCDSSSRKFTRLDLIDAMI